jgi:glycosyltransferase involved in cell wall biosynthesis
MNPKGTIWIDLTMLVHWQGKLTGIQRVEYNLARRFANRPDVGFCIFDKPARKFVEYDFSQVEAKVSDLAGTPARQPSAASLGYTAHIRRAVGPLLPVTVKKGMRRAYHGANRLGRPRSSGTRVRLTAEDTLLVLSGDWSDEVFAAEVQKLKSHDNFRLFQVVYDMLPAVQPAFFVPGMPQQFSDYMESIFRLCDGILAISKATKSDIESFQRDYKLPKVPIKVFRLGDDFVDKDPVKPALEVTPGNFLLCVGTIEARKNHQILYYVVKEALKRKVELPPIVISGKRGWLVDNLLYLIENDELMSGKIKLVHTTDQELSWLFQNCLLTLYPSFYEGWGLPIAESLFYGKMCLSSDESSMPEIAGGLIDYYSPYDAGAILDTIVKYLDNPALLKKKERQIKESYQPTSWDDTFKQVEEFIIER